MKVNEQMKTWKCTDGFVAKTITADTAQAAAEIYALVPCRVTVVEVDGDGDPVGAETQIDTE